MWLLAEVAGWGGMSVNPLLPAAPENPRKGWEHPLHRLTSRMPRLAIEGVVARAKNRND